MEKIYDFSLLNIGDVFLVQYEEINGIFINIVTDKHNNHIYGSYLISFEDPTNPSFEWEGDPNIQTEYPEGYIIKLGHNLTLDEVKNQYHELFI